jgi:hypothetical protein
VTQDDPLMDYFIQTLNEEDEDMTSEVESAEVQDIPRISRDEVFDLEMLRMDEIHGANISLSPPLNVLAPSNDSTDKMILDMFQCHYVIHLIRRIRAKELVRLLLGRGLKIFNYDPTTRGEVRSVWLKVPGKRLVVESVGSDQARLFYTADLHIEVMALLEDIKHLTFEVIEEPEEPKASISVLTPEMETINFNLDDPELDVAASYVPEIASQHERAVQKLREGRKGILLLHGSPGTGKTTYIRHLTKEVYEKDFIFISSDLAPQIANPEFTRFLMNNVGCILVIEDAEQVMRKRVSGKNTAVSVLLNLGDGLMSDILGVQFVCTFNCELDEIDPALTRKGRLLGNMEFKPLSPEQATALATKIGKPFTYTTPTTVAEIYNREG